MSYNQVSNKSELFLSEEVLSRWHTYFVYKNIHAQNQKSRIILK